MFIIWNSNIFVYNNYVFNFLFTYLLVLLSVVISIRIGMSNIDPAVRHWKFHIYDFIVHNFIL